MARFDDIDYLQNVERVIPARIRIIQVMLYIAVALFALIGLSGGLAWGILATGTLVFAWYFMGLARVSFLYHLEGEHLKVKRTSGFKSRPKTEDFADFDLTRLRVLAPEGSPLLDEAEADTKAAQPRRVTYDLSDHDRNRECAVMYLEGVGADSGRWQKVYFQPDGELLRYIRMIAPGRVRD